MIIIRWVLGLFRLLLGAWSQPELAYYAKTGLDPKIPAFQRWEVKVKQEEKRVSQEEEMLKPRSYSVFLIDKFMLTPEDLVFFTADKDKVDALQGQYERELRSRSSGDFYYSMVKGRKLDFFHNFKVVQERPLEASEIDEEQKREMFLR